MFSDAIAGCAGAYHDRVCAPRETLARLKPHFAALGITRLARQTGLDVLGIPCFSAIRPNAMSLAVSQGKGVDDDAAMISAAMEAAEFAIAELPPAVAWRGSARSLDALDMSWFDPSRVLPFGEGFDADRRIDWVAGRGVFSGRPALVPRDAIRFDGAVPDLKGIAQNTNGLASGNTEAEAEFHALCELIERDATTLFSLLPIEQQAARAVAVSAFADPLVAALAGQVASAGLELKLFDLTSDLGVATVMAVIGPRSSWRYYDHASGTGTHPVAARAAVRAITEAAQSRITAIAGARDDIALDRYGARPDAIATRLLAQPTRADGPRGMPFGTSLAAARAFLEDRLGSGGVREPIAITLGGAGFGIAVVRLISDQLEDREANVNWRPGGRAVTALLAAA